jgi:uncharacterized protein (DUF1330 family)
MKISYKLAIVFVIGIAIGGSVIQGLHAQATPPTYAFVEINNITDPDGLKTIGPKAGPAVAAYGGKFLTHGNAPVTAVDGTSPARFVVIEFDSLAKAQAWRASAAQMEVDGIIRKTAKLREFFVEGIAQ